MNLIASGLGFRKLRGQLVDTRLELVGDSRSFRLLDFPQLATCLHRLHYQILAPGHGKRIEFNAKKYLRELLEIVER